MPLLRVGPMVMRVRAAMVATPYWLALRRPWSDTVQPARSLVALHNMPSHWSISKSQVCEAPHTDSEF